ncbi:hypothetical protein A7U60_g6036 [Sanghuangporus baumii]|uniref:Uncharacterized protein n=1 Tax=Sanghuangporus baumii TaxID=108892 RepID=A0A9Q5HVP0_SANBA|nr:hypothetical protein A7U60_g6036 [Sanghuangporus baumii]
MDRRSSDLAVIREQQLDGMRNAEKTKQRPERPLLSKPSHAQAPSKNVGASLRLLPENLLPEHTKRWQEVLLRQLHYSASLLAAHLAYYHTFDSDLGELCF